MKSQIKTLSPTTDRRVFMLQSVVGVAAIGATLQAKAQALVAENDPQAVTFAYKADATKVDKAKQPKYVAGQMCSNCALFKATAGAAAGACPLFAGKQVAAKAWCNAWAKKA